jgi:glutathione S-transferase
MFISVLSVSERQWAWFVLPIVQAHLLQDHRPLGHSLTLSSLCVDSFPLIFPITAAQRSWMTLVEKNIPFELRKVDLNNKSEDFVAVYQTISPDPDAPAKVPILLDGDTHLIESQIIVEYLATKYREIGTDILPADPAQLAKAKLFIDTFTNSVIAPFFALFRADTPEAVADGRTKLGAGLTVLDTCLRMHGSEEGGAFFLGEQFSIADVSTVPFLQRIMVSMPVFRGIDIEELMIENELDRLRKWSEAVLKRPSAIETKPADDVLVDSLRKFVVEMKTEE